MFWIFPKIRLKNYYYFPPKIRLTSQPELIKVHFNPQVDHFVIPENYSNLTRFRPPPSYEAISITEGVLGQFIWNNCSPNNYFRQWMNNFIQLPHNNNSLSFRKCSDWARKFSIWNIANYLFSSYFRWPQKGPVVSFSIRDGGLKHVRHGYGGRVGCPWA